VTTASGPQVDVPETPDDAPEVNPAPEVPEPDFEPDSEGPPITEPVTAPH
jgi:hypothetical protein